MDARNDALVEAARFILHVRDCAGDDCVATVGAIEVEPNATNVVPARVTVAVDARSADPARLHRLISDIGFEPRWVRDPVPMGDAFGAVLPGRAAARLRRGPRRDVRAERVDALRPLAERRRVPPSGRAVERGGHRARDRCTHGCTR